MARYTPKFNPRYPSIEDLREGARKRIPRFAFEYLDSGCNEEVNLRKNTREIREVELLPRYLDAYKEANMTTKIFGQEYDAPFGISPIGLQGLMWPNSPEILAKAAFDHNIPFILSTVTTSSIERISEITEGKAWFQLYHPTEKSVRDDLIQRAEAAGCPVLVLLCDTPVFGFRAKEIKNGLSMPPKMNIANILQVLGKPKWAFETLKHGQPNFEVLRPYMPKGLNLKQLGLFMDQTFSKRMDMDKIAQIRDLWKGKLVLKGVATEADTEKAISLGLDGIIVSNHGGRQLDAGESTIKPLTRIAAKYGDQLTVMMDSGVRSGPDIARTLASGAQFAFLGRSFMYGAAALGKSGGDHTAMLLKTQLKQVMEQIGCPDVSQLPNFKNL
ncbi:MULTISPECIES: alpha-hydroxy acid oxidase [Flavobacteriaceae]|jgi:L-lactate dehydrogenase (cytochrome)|uniref:alpha-hydroxy acid oxidase n=1 Tax=Flavobacteriaceae TaxID=49546 RepID=UPI002349AFBA|nr:MULTISPECIES: alpha-hydroxy acid oxidase [unclassified Allomuricauda]MCR9265313.1 alpha-hydroxy-acid oxidizing protein [Flavobacteriaceae bacterium]MDC6361692.1 alpha-hydroxy acid oxidase [Muricauda sp. SP22]